MRMWSWGPQYPAQIVLKGKTANPTRQHRHLGGEPGLAVSLLAIICLSLEISAEGSSCPGAGQRWAVEPEPPPTGSAPQCCAPAESSSLGL